MTILPADSMITPYRVPILTLIGNPNTGKTTPFNAVTGLSQQFCNYPGVTFEHKVVTCTATRARGLGLAHRHGRPHPFSRPQGDHLGVRHHLQPRQRQGRRIREPARHLVLRPAYLRPARGAGPLIMDWQTPVAVAIAPLAGRYALWPLAQKPRRKPVASADSQLLQIESPDRS